MHHRNLISLSSETKSDISFLRNSWTFEHSDSFKGSPGSHSWSALQVAARLLAYPLLVSLALSHLCCLCSLISRTRNCARLLIVPIPVLKAAVKSTKEKSHKWQQCMGRNYCACGKCGRTDQQTNRLGQRKAVLGPAEHTLLMPGW